MRYEPGDCVLLILQNPREKIFGLIDEVSPAGITIRGIDLEYFEDWSRAIANGEPHLEMSETFFPMWRVERMSRDKGSVEIPSMQEQFEERTGLRLAEC
ncbi:MAG: hypothetical protein ACRD43_13785 [Pyrinomonadaceae bacterium]